ncbi:hypothetical protein D3C85_1569190 [compost metagenome]
MVVGAAYFVAVTMGKLALDPILVVPASVQLGAEQVAEPVAGLASLISHQTKCLVDCVLAHWPLRVGASKDQGVTSGDSLEQAQDGNGLAGQGDDMRPAGLHTFFRNRPDRGVYVELRPRSLT